MGGKRNMNKGKGKPYFGSITPINKKHK